MGPFLTPGIIGIKFCELTIFDSFFMFFFFFLGQDIRLEEQERSKAAEVHQERHSASQIWTTECQTGQKENLVLSICFFLHLCISVSV